MTHGPCGGVQADGSCEVGGACPFVEFDDARAVATSEALGSWAAVRTAPAERLLAPAAADVFAVLSGRAAASAEAGAAVPSAGVGPAAASAGVGRAARPFVVADLPSPGVGGGAVGASEASAAAEQDRRLAAALAGSVDAVLLGDAPWARVQLPPAVRGANVAGEGVLPWCGVNCRDRNRAALESELAGLVAMGVPALHCVTGDHTSLGHRPDARPVFDLDSTALASLAARSTPLLISAAESPSAPPQVDRPARAAAKIDAGAQVLFVNHCDVVEFAAFAAALADRRPHPTLPGAPAVPLIACVPLVTTRAAAERIAKYLHHEPAPELLAALEAADPVAAAVHLAVTHAERLLAIPGVAGIDLSAPAGPGEAPAVAAALAQAGRALGAGA